MDVALLGFLSFKGERFILKEFLFDPDSFLENVRIILQMLRDLGHRIFYF